MELTIIIILTILGVVLIFAEILLLPGLTVAAVFSVCSFIAAIIMTFVNYGLTAAMWLFVGSVVLSVASIMLCVRRKSLKSITLNDIVGSTVENNISLTLNKGDKVYTYTRLAPMGSIISVNGEIFEAKSISGFIDQKSLVEIVDFENGIAIVRN